MNEVVLAKIDALLREKKDMQLQAMLQKLELSVLADIIEDLPRGKRKTFRLLQPETQADVAALLSENSQAQLLPRLPDDALARFLHFCDEDDATDILQYVTSDRQQRILGLMKEQKRRKIEKLLTFGSETAGGLMDLNFIELEAGTGVHAAITAVQEFAKHHKQVPIVVTFDRNGLHWVPPRELLSAPHGKTIRDVAKQVPVAGHGTDRENVLKLMSKANSDVACVVDDHQKVLGVIHLNDLLRVAQAEASEDAYRMAAVTPIAANYLDTPFVTVWRKRIVWLSVLFVAELFTFTALANFEDSIAAVTALALFVPLCISTGGNSGSQAATLITRALALGELSPRDWFRVLRHELFMGLALGVTLGLVGLFRAYLTPESILGGADRWMLALVIAQSVGMICLWGTLVGSMLPLLFRRFGFDPGYASSPFVATFVDVTGIVIYFSVANALLL